MARAPNVQVTGAKELRKELKKAGDDLSELKAAHEGAGQIVAAEGRQLVPVRSGALAATIRPARIVSGVSVRAGGSRVPYAGPIHWGWPARNIVAQPFLSDAATGTESTWIKLYEDSIEKALEKVKGDS